jgi:hypothetical protein
MLLLRLLSRVRKKRRSVEPASLEISVAAAPEPTRRILRRALLLLRGTGEKMANPDNMLGVVTQS